MTSSGAVFIPTFRGPIEAYTKKSIKSFLPRVRSHYEYDDLYQEAVTVYLWCKKRYTTVDNPAWFMAMYKRGLQIRFCDILKACSKQWPLVPLDNTIPHGTTDCDGLLAVALKQMPKEILDALVTLATCGTRVVRSVAETESSSAVGLPSRFAYNCKVQAIQYLK